MKISIDYYMHLCRNTIMKTTNTYYELTAELDGERHVLFGSYNKADVTAEKRIEMPTYKEDGYKRFKIESKEVEEEADSKVYEEIMTTEEFFQKHAPDYNFELSHDGLIQEALAEGFISKAGANKYIYTDND